jgi:hypothetical protein
MRATSKVVALMVAMMLGAILSFVDPGSGRAQQETLPARSARGGALARTAHYQFEVFSYTSGVRLFASDPAGAAMSAAALTGTATFYHPNSPRPWFTRRLRPAPTQPGHPAESLDLAIDLGTVPTSGVTVTFEIAGLPDSKEPTATFTTPFTLVASVPGSSRAGQAATPAPTYRISAEQVNYFHAAGFYRTTSGVVLWIPAPGYYHGTPAQYYPRVPPVDASGWQPGHPTNDPARAAIAPAVVAPVVLQAELYWRPRAWGDSGAYQAWVRGQMRQQQAAGRLPSISDRECMKCHRR